MINLRTAARIVLAVMITGGLFATGLADSHPTNAQDRLRVVATHSILADVAANVAGDAADVVALIPRGANPHSYNASAQDVATLSDADMVIINGINFEENLLDVVYESAGEQVIAASECVPVRPILASTADEHAEEHDHEGEHAEEHEGEHAEEHEGEHADEHEDEHDHDMAESPVAAACEANQAQVAEAFGMDAIDEPHDDFLGPLYAIDCGHEHEDEDETEGEHAHEAGSCDPHTWTDPANVGLWALTIRDAFSAADPSNAEIYAENAANYLAQLASVSDEVDAMISTIPDERRTIITNHIAFNYFTERYGLTLVGVVIPSASTTAEPSARDVLALVDTVKEYEVPAIFTETTVSDSLARQIAEEGGAELVSLYTGSLSEDGGGAETYLDYLIYNASAMAGALR